MMDFDNFFKERVDALHAEGRYRVFADLERRRGRFPRAFDHRIGAEVTVWCSNDYLGMGQHPAVLEAMAAELANPAPAPAAPATFPAPATPCAARARVGRAARHVRRRWSSPRLTSPTRRRCRRWPAACPAGRAFGRDEPRLDDRRHPQQPGRAADLPPQRSGHLDALLAGLPAERPKLVCFEIGLFDGRRHRADRRIMRRRRPLRRDDLSRRGACGRALRRARRRHRRARRRRATG